MSSTETDLLTRKPGHFAPGLRGGGETRPGIIGMGATTAVTGTPGAPPSPSVASTSPPAPSPPRSPWHSASSLLPLFRSQSNSLTDCEADSLDEGLPAVAGGGPLPPTTPPPPLLALILTDERTSDGGRAAAAPRRPRARGLKGTSRPLHADRPYMAREAPIHTSPWPWVGARGSGWRSGVAVTPYGLPRIPSCKGRYDDGTYVARLFVTKRTEVGDGGLIDM